MWINPICIFGFVVAYIFEISDCNDDMQKIVTIIGADLLLKSFDIDTSLSVEHYVE